MLPLSTSDEFGETMLQMQRVCTQRALNPTQALKWKDLLHVNTPTSPARVTLGGSPHFPPRSICETRPSIFELSGRPVGTPGQVGERLKGGLVSPVSQFTLTYPPLCCWSWELSSNLRGFVTLPWLSSGSRRSSWTWTSTAGGISVSLAWGPCKEKITAFLPWHLIDRNWDIGLRWWQRKGS